MDAFERKLITREKLEYLLSFTKTTPEQLGILPDKEYVLEKGSDPISKYK